MSINSVAVVDRSDADTPTASDDVITRPHEVPVPALATDRLGEFLGPARLEQFRGTARRVVESLAGATIWNVNSTAAGGGVAEMLWALLPWVRGADIDTRWLVVAGDAEFFTITKRVHNHLYGFPGDGGPLGDHERSAYRTTLAANADELRALVRPGDTVILHDPQTAGLIGVAKAAGAHVVWRCHIGRDRPNGFTEQGWAFLREDLLQADAVIFSRQAFIPSWLPPERVAVIPPSLDPFSPKNQDLSEEMVQRILVHAGLLRGEPDSTGFPLFRRTDGSPGRVDRHADILQSGPPPSPGTPLIVQVSRWDHAKDMAGVMAAFAEHVADQSDAHLLLVGPSVAGVQDDPEGGQVLQECVSTWQALPHAVRGRVHLACLPMRDLEENAAIVNAIQRHATVITQKSLAEGFGLTVAEAMWKARPVVASAVGGMRDQVLDGETGLLIGDPTDLLEFGTAIVRLLDDPAWASQMGKAAHQRAHELYLGDVHLERWAELVLRLPGGSDDGH
jgi:trehalose synthase